MNQAGTGRASAIRCSNSARQRAHLAHSREIQIGAREADEFFRRGLPSLHARGADERCLQQGQRPRANAQYQLIKIVENIVNGVAAILRALRLCRPPAAIAASAAPKTRSRRSARPLASLSQRRCVTIRKL